MKFWISLAGYELVWFAAVIGAGHGLTWPGVVALLPYVAWQLFDGGHAWADLRLMLASVALGCVLDGGLQHAGVLRYAASGPLLALAPVWILALWASFALTFTQSLRYLQQRLWLAALLGAIGGPAAYLGAARGWHAVTFPQPAWPALLWLALGWGLATPLLAWLAARWTRGAFQVPLSWRGPVA